MPVTDVTSDIETRTLTITADFAAPVDAGLEGVRRPAPDGADLGSADLPRHDRRPCTHSPVDELRTS